AYNIYKEIMAEGKVDLEAFGEIFNRLVSRHDSFRTGFFMRDGDVVQEIVPHMDFKIEYHECEAAENNDAAIEAKVRDFVRPFDLEKAPLIRVGLFKLEAEKYFFIYDMHHIISDGTSIGILVHEFFRLHHGETPAEMPIQYKDYSEWINDQSGSEMLKKSESHWLEQFADGAPQLDLPLDFSRPPVWDFKGHHLDFALPPGMGEKLKQSALDEEVSFYMLMSALLSILLSKLASCEDVAIGTVVAGRAHKDLESVVGMFVNTLVMRHSPTGDKTFPEFLKEVKEGTLQAFDNQQYPFE
ncbi:MAG: hypothetical protein GY765_19440, partial [bacterium]|nr:hypothetical protein [bacterium]